MNGRKMAANIRIVKLSFRLGAEEIPVELRRHIAVAINCAIDELHFECMESFAITDGSKCVRLDGLPRNVGGDFALLGGACRAEG